VTSIEGFREKLIAAFPPRPFYGRVSTHNECDDGIALLKELPGKRWDEIQPAFLDFNSGSLPLLEARALVAFLPAWLLRSMETVADESVLAELTMYFLCPHSEHEGRGERKIVELVSLFDAPQRSIIEDFLRSIVRKETLGAWHADAERGSKLWSVQS
jgi:hypothetical protein